MADGLFDDLIPKQRGTSAGLFDDLVPAKAPARRAESPFAGVTARVDTTAAPVARTYDDPYAAQAVPDYSRVFRDEAADNDGLGNIAVRTLVGRVPEILANVIQAPGTVATAVAPSSPTARSIASTLGGAAQRVRDIGFEREFRQAGYGEPSVSGGQLVEALTPGEVRPEIAPGITRERPLSASERAGRVATFIPETLIASGADILSTLNPATLGGYIAGRGNEIARNRAENMGRETPTAGDVGIASVAAPAEALLERFTTGRLLPGGLGEVGEQVASGVLPAVGRVLRETGLQGALGGVEELIPYLAEQFGSTINPATGQGALETFAGGAVAEGGLGGAAQTVREVSRPFGTAPSPEAAIADAAVAGAQARAAEAPLPGIGAPLPQADVLGGPEIVTRPEIAQAMQLGGEAIPVPPPSAAPTAEPPTPQRAVAATSKPRVTLAEVQAEQARRAAGPITSEGATAEQLEPAQDQEPIEPTPERRRFASPDEFAREDFVRRAGELQVAPEAAEALAPAAPRDTVTGFFDGRQGNAKTEAIERAKQHQVETDEPAVYVAADLFNLSGLNEAVGNRAEAANTHYRAMAGLLDEELNKIGADVVPMRTGGDEIGFVVVNATPEQVQTAVDAAQTRVQQYAQDNGLADIPHPKRSGERGVGLHIGATEIDPESSVSEILNRADDGIDSSKRGRIDVTGRTGQAPGPRGDDGGREAAARAGGGESLRPAGGGAETVPPARQGSTGTKNEAVRAERASEGRDPILQDAARTNAETLGRAQTTLADNPSRGEEVVQRLARDGVAGVSLDDEAVLLVHKVNLRNQRDAAAKRATDPDASEEAKAVAERQWRELEAQINEIDQATFASGREWGRLGQFRQRMLREDFTFEALERKERVREGRPLTAAESANVKQMADKIAELQKRADALQARVDNAASEASYDDLVKRMAEALKGPRRRPTLDRLREAANESRAALAGLEGVKSRKGQSGAVIDPVAFYHLARIGAFHIATGAATFADWTAKMRADLGDVIDTVREALPAVFRASKEQAQISREGPSVPDVLAAIDPESVTPADVRKLAEAHIRAGLRGEQSVMQAVADSLDRPEADIRKLFVQSSPGHPQTLDEAKAELRNLRAAVRLQEEIDRIESGQEKARGPLRETAASPEVQAKREQLAQLRRTLAQDRAEQRQAQREAERPVPVAVDPEDRYQNLRGKDIQRRIQKLQDRIAAGDFERTPPRVPRALNEANQRAQFELDKAKEAFLRHQFEAELAKRSPLRKVFGGAVDTANFARALMTSLDLSGVLRQGGFISYGHPVAALKALGPSLKAFASEQSEHAARKEIESRPNFPLYKKAGLEFTGIGTGPLNKVEEAYASRWVDRFPKALGGGLIRGSGRSYTTFLNRLRADAFDAMAASLSRTATPTPEEARAIANYVNVATGRGKVGTSENAGQVLNTMFFAPRLVASRFQLLAGQPLYGGSNRTRKLVAQEYARFMLGVGVATSLAAFGLGADEDEQGQLIELDPRSSNFGKIHFGNTWLDPLAGLAQVTTLLSRLATGETKTGKGVVKPLRSDYTLTDLRRALGDDIEPHKLAKDGSLPFGSDDAWDVLLRFLRTKLAPIPGAVANTLSGKNVIGQKVTPAETAASLVTPMSFGDIGAIMEEQGIPRGTAITLLGLLGIGVQHREQKDDAAAKDGDADPSR